MTGERRTANGDVVTAPRRRLGHGVGPRMLHARAFGFGFVAQSCSAATNFRPGRIAATARPSVLDPHGLVRNYLFALA